MALLLMLTCHSGPQGTIVTTRSPTMSRGITRLCVRGDRFKDGRQVCLGSSTASRRVMGGSGSAGRPRLRCCCCCSFSCCAASAAVTAAWWCSCWRTSSVYRADMRGPKLSCSAIASRIACTWVGLKGPQMSSNSSSSASLSACGRTSHEHTWQGQISAKISAGNGDMVSCHTNKAMPASLAIKTVQSLLVNATPHALPLCPGRHQPWIVLSYLFTYHRMD